MIPSPLGSTPFSVKDILNLEHQQITNPIEKDCPRIAADFGDINRTNCFGRLFSHPTSGHLTALPQELNKDSISNHRSNMYDAIHARMAQSSARINSANSGQPSNNKPDQTWMFFDNMADVISTSKSSPKETGKSTHNADLHETSSIQAAASTLIDFSQHLHNQTYNNSSSNQKQTNDIPVYSTYYSPTECYESNYVSRLKEVHYEEAESYNISHDRSQISCDKISDSEVNCCVSPDSDKKTITTLQPTTHTSCTNNRFHSPSHPDGFVKLESPYQNSLASLEEGASEFTVNCFSHISRSSATVNHSSAGTDDLVEFSSASPVNTVAHASPNDPSITSQMEERRIIQEDGGNHVIGTFDFNFSLNDWKCQLINILFWFLIVASLLCTAELETGRKFGPELSQSRTRQCKPEPVFDLRPYKQEHNWQYSHL